MITSGHLEIPVNDPCPFCDYLEGRRAYTILFRDSLVAALVTREPRGVSHVLAMPIRHFSSILEINDEEGAALISIIRRTARAIDSADQRPGIAIWQNNGVPAHQLIGHLHFHIAGTLAGGGTNMGHVAEISLTETDEIARRLIDADLRANN